MSALPSVERETRLVVTARRRGPSRLDEPSGEAPPDPSLDELVERVRAAPRSGRLWLVGGEPTLRADLPALLRAFRPLASRGVGLACDGLAFGDARALAPLREAGLGAVRIALHAARPEAHDWLVCRQGALHRALRGLRACTRAGLETEVMGVVTRPAMTQLGELVVLSRRLGASALHLELVRERGAAAAAFEMLAPRLPLFERHLEEAAREARRRGLLLAFEGLPPCALGTMARLLAEAPSWLYPRGGAWERYRTEREALHLVGERCATCPGAPRCAGAPADYLGHFGWSELSAPPRALPAIVELGFGGPSRIACPSCGDHGAARVGPEPAGPEPVEPEPVEPSRAIRQRLVRAAAAGRTLRIASAASLAHPDAASLLADVALLPFARVEVAGEGSALDAMSDAELRALRCLSRLDVALYGPDAERHDAHVGRPGAFAAALAGLDRLARLAKIPVGAFAVLHHAGEVAAYAAAWERGELPGEPAFRFSPAGGSLVELSRARAALPVGPARTALEALLPPCLLDGDGPPLSEESAGESRPRASGSDRLGSFRPCACASERPCPGIAAGWTAARGATK